METLSYCQLMQRCGELEAQVKQLAAENAALKLWASQSVELWDAGCDIDGHMRDVPQSLSTDAILASLRAEAMADGVIALADKVESLPYFVGVKQQFIRNFAAQLRSKPEVQS